MYFLGIDGGGTKTSFKLINKDGNVIGQVVKGTCHYNQIGYEALEILLKEGIDEIVKNAKIRRNEITKAYIGLAGYGKLKEVVNKIEKVVENSFNDIPYELGNDVQVAMAGALKGEEGIIIVAGTGSIGFSLRNNEYNRVGGWGPFIGDEGSAHWIGKKTLEAFSKQCDGRCEKSFIYSNIKAILELENDYEIIKYINEDIKCDRSKVAEFAKICYESALEGDKEAREIYIEAAKELAELVKVLIKDFDENTVKVSYAGGVFKSGNLILEPLKWELSRTKAKLEKPVLPPDLGACLLAYKSINNIIPNSVIENMMLFSI